MKGESISKNCYGTAVNTLADRAYNKVRLGINTDTVRSAKKDLRLYFPCDIADLQDITDLIVYRIFFYFDLTFVTASLTESIRALPSAGQRESLCRRTDIACNVDVS